MSTQLAIEGVILSFPDLWVPKRAKNRSGKETGEPKYKVDVLLPDDYDWNPVLDACDEAAQKKFEENVQDYYALPFKLIEKSEYRDFDGQYQLRAKSKESDPPTVVDQNVDPLMDKSQIFSGCIVDIQVNFWGYEVEDRGIACDLNIVRLVDNSSENVIRRDGRKSAKDVFQPIGGAPKALSRPGRDRGPSRDSGDRGRNRDDERSSRDRGPGRSQRGESASNNRRPSYMDED